MGILDDAIREHLDLKRKHGARDSELREIEDEAFGAGEQPDPFVGGQLLGEVPSPEAAAGAVGVSGAERRAPGPPTPAPDLGEPSAGGEEPTRLVEPAEPISPPEALLREPELEEPVPGSEPAEEPIPGQERLEEPIPGQERLPEPGAREDVRAAPEPAAEEVEAPAPSESESLEELIAEEEPFPEDVEAPEAAPRTEERRPATPTETRSPEDSLEPPSAGAEIEEPDLGAESSVPEPPPPPPPGAERSGRARGRADVPTQEHPPPGDGGGLPAIPTEEGSEAPRPEAEAPDAGPQLYDFETDEDLLEPRVPPGETDDDFEALGPAEEEAPYLAEEEPYREEPGGTVEAPAEEEAYEGPSLDPEETYEEDTEDDLWFEKGPPKDFDFEDEDR